MTDEKWQDAEEMSSELIFGFDFVGVCPHADAQEGGFSALTAKTGK